MLRYPMDCFELVDKLSENQRALCSKLEGHSLEIRSAYLRALHALHSEDYDGRLAHFAHPLCEIIDLLARKDQTDDEKGKPLDDEHRLRLLTSTAAGMQSPEFHSMCEQLAQQYDELHEFVHNGRLDQKKAEELLASAEEVMSRLTRPQTETLDEIDRIIHLVSLESFEDSVENNPLEFSKKASKIIHLHPEMQHAFLHAIENAVNARKKVDWNAIIALIEYYVGSTSRYLKVHSTFDLILESCRIIEKGLKESQIDYDFRTRVFCLVKRLIHISNGLDNVEKKSDDADSMFISINNLGGMSFHVLFRYALWCYHNEKSKHVFYDIKEILENYANKNLGTHTISRHSAIGMFFPKMLDFDPQWTDDTILAKIFSSKLDNKIAFWESYVAFNSAQRDVLLRLHTMYQEFLNGATSKQIHARSYRSTIEHVTLGYLYGIEHFDKIFQNFISDADSESIRNCGFLVYCILADNQDIPKIKDKIIKLWKTQKFIDHAMLDMWFARHPFDKKENIQLFLNYMQKHSGKLILFSFPLKELERYVDDFPYEVAQCIQMSTHKAKPHHLSSMSGMLKPMLARLYEKNISSVNDICKNTIESFVNLGHDGYDDFLRDLTNDATMPKTAQ